MQALPLPSLLCAVHADSTAWSWQLLPQPGHSTLDEALINHCASLIGSCLYLPLRTCLACKVSYNA
jgi:hypothetical protein